MQKWSPEPFDGPIANQRTAVVETMEFESTAAVVGTRSAGATAAQFRSESGFTDCKSLMSSLTPDERSQVYELVQMDVADEYEEREQELRREFEQRLAAAEAEASERFERWSGAIADTLASEIRKSAGAAAQLAVQMAAKIVRRQVEADPDILGRAIEATIFKIAANEPLQIQANPADAEWLRQQSELLEKLHIGEIVADRRIESGGCLIQCQGREWDATLSRQLGSLEDIVTEMLATSEAPRPLTVPLAAAPEPSGADDTPTDPTPESETSNDPGLE